jgi:hypothetical protein
MIGDMVKIAWASNIGKVCLSGVAFGVAAGVVPPVLSFFNIRGQIVSGVKMAFELAGGASAMSAVMMGANQLWALIRPR